jgi:penicillin-binding protein 2
MKRFLVPLLLVLPLAGCSLFAAPPTEPVAPTTLPEPGVTTVPAPDPDAATRRFLDAWKNWDYESMYAMLSHLSQDGISLETFREQYESVRRSAALTGVDYQIVSALVVSPQTAEVRYRISLNSAAVGEIEAETKMDLTRVREDWMVAWSNAVIHPRLQAGNGLQLTVVTPTRANIYDRNGDALASEATPNQDNAAAIWLVPNEIGGEEAEEALLSALRNLFDLATVDPILQRYDPIRDTNYFVPLGVVPYSEYQLYGGLLGELGGVYVRTYSTRYYYGTGLTPFAGGAAPHAVGYVSQIQRDEFEQRRQQGYQGDEFIGRIGIEAAFESELRGVPGGTLVLTDSEGQVIEVLARREPEPPYAVYTTLDRELQSIAQRAIEGFAGAVVVLERDTGAVLAIASSPGFDPNLFDPQNPNLTFSEEAMRLLNQSNQPFVNRAVSGIYPPGSIFKIITMAAALESEHYTPDTVYYCGLTWEEVPGLTLNDWRLEKELPASGDLTLQGGLERSCNPWFYHIGFDLYNKGLTTALPDMARAFGLGQTTGIEISDQPGTVPDPENKLERTGEEWSFRDAVQMAIGQSFLEVTPLQVARYVAAVGNGGTLYQPQLVSTIQNAEGTVLQSFEPNPQAELPLSPENLAAIQEAMVNVVRDAKATAYRRFLGLSVNVAGKTGTASITGVEEPHAWFAGYTFEDREDQPDIAIAVVLERQGEGSDWAAPVFRRIVETYFKGRPLQLYPWEARLWVERTPEPEEEATETPTP